MPRPRIRRRVCQMPGHLNFSPRASCGKVNLLVEEYEVIRLIDYKGLNQEECADVMGVARTSVQKMYNEARHKLSQALVEGKSLQIGGGDYYICDDNSFCHRRFCSRNHPNKD